MYKNVNVIMAAALSVVILTGCQSSSQSSAPLPDTQVSQLSSMVAAASWLRDHCNRQDIASNSELTRSALEQAKQRRWDTPQPVLQQLDEQIAERYQALTTDSVSMDEKCSTLNRVVAKFLQQTQASQ